MTRAGVCVAACLALAGCRALTVDPAAGGNSLFVPAGHIPPEIVWEYDPTPETSRFEIRADAHWVFWTLPLNHPDWEVEMKKAMGSADGLANLVVRTEMGWGHTLAGLLSLGFYRSETIVVTGDRVRWNRGGQSAGESSQP